MMNFKEGLQRFELYSGSGQADQLKLGFKIQQHRIQIS